MSMPLLETLGVVPLLDDGGFLPKSGAVFVWGGKKKRIDLGFPRPYRAYEVRRAHFDQILLDSASGAGATVFFGQWAKNIVREPEGRLTGIVSDGEHGPIHHQARIVVDASGLFQFMPKRMGLNVNISGPRRIAISAYYSGAGRVEGAQANNVISEATRDGWLWFIPLDEQTTSVGFVGDEDDLKSKPGAALVEQIGCSNLIRSLLDGATLEGHARLLRYTNHIVGDPLWQDGRILIGDAGLFVDPLFSTGVHGALYSGISAAAATVGHLADGLPEAEMAVWYDQTIREHYARVQTMVRLLYGINGGDSRFWSTRDLSDMSAADAEQTVRDLGSTSIPLFQAGLRDGVLDIPDALAPLLQSYAQSPSVRSRVSAPAITLAPAASVREGYMRHGDRVVPALAVHSSADRRAAVQVPADSPPAALLRRLAKGPVRRECWLNNSQLEPFVSVLKTSGLLDAVGQPMEMA
jgi:halogenation protein CepH